GQGPSAAPKPRRGGAAYGGPRGGGSGAGAGCAPPRAGRGRSRPGGLRAAPAAIPAARTSASSLPRCWKWSRPGSPRPSASWRCTRGRGRATSTACSANTPIERGAPAAPALARRHGGAGPARRSGQQVVADDRPAVDRYRGVAAVLDVVRGDAAFEIQAPGVGVAERARRHQPHAGPRVAAVHAVEFGLE